MTEFRVVPDNMRERETVRRGRPPVTPLAQALLKGQTVFVSGPKKGWGNIYKLAKNNGFKARTKSTLVNDEVGTLIWFEEVN